MASKMQLYSEMDFSDESVEEDDLPTSSSSGNYFQELMFHHHHLRVIKYLPLIKDIANGNRTNILAAKSPGVQTSTKAVQTEPDMSGVPPLWLDSVQDLAIDVYTGLGNVINLIYRANEKVDAFRYEEMKYFRFENGYYRSTLLPSIRIPAHEVITPPPSEIIKQMLNSLFEKARKLKNGIPESLDAAHQVSFASSEECTILSKDDSGVIKQRTSSATVPKRVDADLESAVPLSYMPPVASSSQYSKLEPPERNSVKLKYEEFYNGIKKRSSTNEIDRIGENFKGRKVKFTNVCKPNAQQGVSRHYHQPKVYSTKGRLNSPQNQFLRRNIPACIVDIPNRVHYEKSERLVSNREKNKSHSIRKGEKALCDFTGHKNFIKQNILALKAPAQTAGSIKSNDGQKSYAALKKSKPK